MQLIRRLASRRTSCLLITVVILLAVSTYFMAWDMDALTGVEFDDYDDDVTMDPMSDGEDDDDEEEGDVEEDEDDEQHPAAAAAAAANPAVSNSSAPAGNAKNDDVAGQQNELVGKRRGIKGIANRGGKHRGRKQKRFADNVGNDVDAQEKDKGQQNQAMNGDDKHQEDGDGGHDKNDNNDDDGDGNDEDQGHKDDNGSVEEDKGDDNNDDDDDPADNNNGKSYDTCDDECKKFRKELESWPSNKPKAFIYYLIHRPAVKSLRRSIQLLHKNFNRRFRYPIVVFVEPNMDNAVDRKRIADMAPTDTSPPPPQIYVQIVRFRIPEYVNASLVPRMAGFGTRKRTIGYRHMCRFHAGGVYEQPIVQSPGLEYGWRLDDDSLIRRPINRDLFQVMRDNGYQYGYRRINTGWSPVDFALWDAVDRYLNATPSLKPTFYRQWPKNSARYFNNFEISDLRVWMSPQYRDYFRMIDRLGGIYYHKWGDAAIKTIAVTLFIPRERTHLFTGITYAHN